MLEQSLLRQKWVRLAACVVICAAAVAVQFAALRQRWPVDTQSDSLRKLEIRSGYELRLDSSGEQPDETILSYEGATEHDHQVTLKIDNGRLSDASRTILLHQNPPQSPGSLTYSPQIPDTTPSGESCQTKFSVAYAKAKSPKDRSVTLFPPLPTDYKRPDIWRTIKLQSASELEIHLSANSPRGHAGPGCRKKLQIGKWEIPVGKDWDLGVIAEANSPVSLTLSPDPKGGGRWHSNDDEMEALLIQPLQPQRLFVSPHGVNRATKLLERMGEPLLTVTGLRMGGDFFDVDLLGQAGEPVASALGIWKWPLLALINVPLLFFVCRDAWRQVRRTRAFPESFLESREEGTGEVSPSGKLRIFMSYSWADKERVEQIHDLLASRGAQPWIDRENIRGGSDWELSIKDQMRQSQRVLIFVSCASVHKAGFAWAEMRLAARIAEEQPEGTDFVIPVKLDNCRLPDLLSRWHCIDLFEPEGADKLLEALGLGQQRQTAHNAEEPTPIPIRTESG